MSEPFARVRPGEYLDKHQRLRAHSPSNMRNEALRRAIDVVHQRFELLAHDGAVALDCALVQAVPEHAPVGLV